MYSELVIRIKELLQNKKIVVVAISGHGGSGKSTLAEKLAKEFQLKDEQIVGIDALHAKNYMQAKNIYSQHDWDELTKLLKDIHTKARLEYPSRDWKGNESKIDVELPKVLIVEGIRLIRPELMQYFDVSVWVDCPLDIATSRAIERNREQGDSDAEIDLWHTKWVPEARKYERDVRPQQIANFIYTEY